MHVSGQLWSTTLITALSVGKHAVYRYMLCICYPTLLYCTTICSTIMLVLNQSCWHVYHYG